MEGNKGYTFLLRLCITLTFIWQFRSVFLHAILTYLFAFIFVSSAFLDALLQWKSYFLTYFLKWKSAVSTSGKWKASPYAVPLMTSSSQMQRMNLIATTDPMSCKIRRNGLSCSNYRSQLNKKWADCFGTKRNSRNPYWVGHKVFVYSGALLIYLLTYLLIYLFMMFLTDPTCYESSSTSGFDPLCPFRRRQVRWRVLVASTRADANAPKPIAQSPSRAHMARSRDCSAARTVLFESNTTHPQVCCGCSISLLQCDDTPVNQAVYH